MKTARTNAGRWFNALIAGITLGRFYVRLFTGAGNGTFFQSSLSLGLRGEDS